MLKFKIIRWALVLCIIIKLAAITGYVYFIRRSLYDISVPYTPILPFCVAIAQLAISGIGVYYILRSCNTFIRHGYFNKQSASLLRTGGYILAITAIVFIVWSFCWRQTTKADGFADLKNYAVYLTGMSHQITVLIVSFALLAVADLVRRGAKLKRENDLTI